MFFGTPEEMVAHMQEHAAQRRMQMQNYEHSENDFLARLVGTDADGKTDPDLLVVFQKMLQRMQHFDWYVPYLLGRVDHLLLNAGICTCGTDHDAELQDALKDMMTKAGADEEAPAPDVTTHVVELIDPEHSPEVLEQYGMEFVKPVHTQNDPNARKVLRCKNCKKPYTTMEDRMLKLPGEAGCDGCHLKSAQGTTWQP
jgi:hypothetical protein